MIMYIYKDNGEWFETKELAMAYLKVHTPTKELYEQLNCYKVMDFLASESIGKDILYEGWERLLKKKFILIFGERAKNVERIFE